MDNVLHGREVLSGGPLHSSRSRWWNLPALVSKTDCSSLVYSLLVLVLFTAFAYRGWLRPILDPDYWYVRWIGDRILAGAYPRTNIWSWTAHETPWVALEPGVGLLYALGGAAWAGFLRGVVITATGVLLAVIAWRPRSAMATVLGFAWVVCLVTYGQSERALTWGNFCLAATVVLLGRRPSAVHLAAASVLVGVWANVHGSFVVGILLIAAHNWRWGCAAAALTFANPSGWRLWEVLLGYGTSADATPFVHGRVVSEWFPPDLTDPKSLCLVTLLVAGAIIAMWRAPPRAFVIIVPVVALGLRHQRFMEVAAIAMLPWFSASLEQFVPAKTMQLSLASLGAVALALGILMPAAHYDPVKFPGNFPFARLAQGRIWNDYEVGGFLGYHGIPVFWDSRADCYPEGVLKDGLGIEIADSDRMALLNKWQIDTVVTGHAAIGNQLSAAGWILEGSYGKWSIYRHAV